MIVAWLSKEEHLLTCKGKYSEDENPLKFRDLKKEDMESFGTRMPCLKEQQLDSC